MFNNITLTSSMRSNLYALKNLTTQMNKTQNRLASGLKVNSAIDNASSYYQARALNNRASDLDALLDSMGQSIQTISTAIKGLEKSGEMLEQAAVIAEAAYEAAIIPEKAWFEAQVGENGAVVSTAQELKDAIAANKETICVYGKIDYFENQTLTMKKGQKLVGTEYFTGYSGNKKFSEINFSGTQDKAIQVANNCLISDLSLNFESLAASPTRANLIDIQSSSRSIIFNNLDLLFNSIYKTSGSQGAIRCGSGSDFTLSGVINIDGYGIYGNSIACAGTCNIARNAIVNIKAMSHSGTVGYGVDFFSGGVLNVYGKLNIESDGGGIWLERSPWSGCVANIYTGAEVTIKSNYSYNIGYRDTNNYNKLTIAAGAKLNIKDVDGEVSLLSNGYVKSNNSYDASLYLSSSDLLNSGSFEVVGNTIDWSTWRAIPERGDVEEPTRTVYDKEQYDSLMTAYDEMVSDSSYQGINLITGGSLTTMFNENRTHSFVVQGEDMRSNALGITIREWNTRDDIAASIKEIKAAMGKVRDVVESLGNNLSIIQTRENFTDKLIDVLETGADDLVLADMNEESANYLALQTRNNLAVNALSLAAQSNNSVLKLF